MSFQTTIWALRKRQSKPESLCRSTLGRVGLITSPWPFFSDACLALRALLRYAFAWPRAAAVVQINGVIDGS